MCSAILAGCASMTGINTHAQMQKADKLEAGRQIAQASRIAWPTEKWWEAYHDAQLNVLIEKGIAGNPTLDAARARVTQAGAFADNMRSGMRPNLRINASAMRERYTAQQFIPPPWAGNTSWDNQVQIAFSYDLDLWGRQKSLWQSSLDGERAASAEAQMVRLELVTAIVRSYVQMALEYELRDIALANKTEIEQRIAILRRGLNAGMGTEMQATEAQTHLPLARMQIEALDMRIALLGSQIAAYTGQGPGAGERIARPAMNLDAAIGLPEVLPANLIGRRPDVLAYRWQVEAARNGIESATAAFYPDMTMLAVAGSEALGFGQLCSASAAMAGAGPAISLPIFDGGRRRAYLSAKSAAYDIAVDNYNAQLVLALQEISDQLSELQSNAVERAQAQIALASSQKSCSLAEASYRAGLGDYAHVIDAKIAMLQQQAALAGLQAAELDGYAGLMRSIGGGVQEER